MSRQFLVEAFLPRGRQHELPASVARVSAAAAGTGVRHLRSIAVPEDEVCFHLFEGASADAVRAVARAAEIDADRVIACRTADGDAHDRLSTEGMHWLM